MAKNYKDYCREAVKRDPKTYSSRFNEDGSLKKMPTMSSIYKKVPKDVPRTFLKKVEPKPLPKKEPPELEITGTEIRLKGRKQNLALKKIPEGASKKEYKRIWMYNDRVRKKIKMLKEKYGVTTTL